MNALHPCSKPYRPGDKSITTMPMPSFSLAARLHHAKVGPGWDSAPRLTGFAHCACAVGMLPALTHGYPKCYILHCMMIVKTDVAFVKNIPRKYLYK